MEQTLLTKFDSKEWFSERNLLNLEYQVDFINNKIPASLKNNKFPTVLAACPSAGKTIMSICFIEKYLVENEGARVLVLTHGTTILRSQYAEEVKKMKPGFTWKTIESGDWVDINYQVNITIPQTINYHDNPKFDLVIVDEAHHYYFAGMVQGIIRETKPKHQILLTGTPSPFIRAGYPVIPKTVNDLLDIGMVSDLVVELASSTYNFNSKDYNADFELRNNVIIRKEATISTLDLLLEKVLNRLKSIFKDEPIKYAVLNNSIGWPIALKSLQKTMIACKSQEQAKQVYDYFYSKGINCALSITDTDFNSDEIKRFKQDKECLILIVVSRGVLGFNYPEMENVIDMTASQNIDRIFQLMCRVIRKHPNGKKKLFFKIAPHYLADYFEFLMTFVLCLTDEEYYLKFNGKNLLELEVPVVRKKTKKEHNNKYLLPSAEIGQEVDNPKKNREIKVMDYVGLPSIRFFKDILHKNHDVLNSYAYVQLGEIRKCLLQDKDISESISKVGFEYLMNLSEKDFIKYVKDKVKENKIDSYSSLTPRFQIIVNVIIKRGLRKNICEALGWKYNVNVPYIDYKGTSYELLCEVNDFIIKNKITSLQELSKSLKEKGMGAYVRHITIHNLNDTLIKKIKLNIQEFPDDVLINLVLKYINNENVTGIDQFIHRINKPIVHELYNRSLTYKIFSIMGWVFIDELGPEIKLGLDLLNSSLTNDEIERN